MGVFPNGDLIVSRFQNISAALYLDALRIIGGKVFFVNGKGQFLRLTGIKKLRFSKINEIDCGFLDTAVVVGRGKINLYYILSGYLTGIFHLHIKAQLISIILKVLHGLGKAGVGKTVAEGILHSIFVIQEAFFCCRFIELVTGVNAFRIVYEGNVSFRGFVCRHNRLLQVIHIGIGMVSDVVNVGSLLQILHKGIHGSSGGVHISLQNLTQSGKSCYTCTGSPNHGLNLIIVIRKAQLHGVIGIDNQNYLIEIFTNRIQHILFRLGKLQIRLSFLKVRCGTVVLIGGTEVSVLIRIYRYFLGDIVGSVNNGTHIHGKVCALSAGSAQYYYGHIGETLRLIHQIIRIVIRCGLGKAPILLFHVQTLGNSAVLILLIHLRKVGI